MEKARKVRVLPALLLGLTLVSMTSSCGKLPLGILGGGGPNVAANTQVGKENRQAVFSVEDKQQAGRDIVTKEVEAQQVETVTINNEKIPVWVLIALVIGWLAPSPGEIGNGIYRLFRRRT